MQNVEQKKLAWPYVSSVIAAVFLATGGIFEDKVAELFAPISSKGGWAGALNIKPPGVDEVRQLKKAKGYTMRTADQQHAVGLVFPADSTGLA